MHKALSSKVSSLFQAFVVEEQVECCSKFILARGVEFLQELREIHLGDDFLDSVLTKQKYIMGRAIDNSNLTQCNSCKHYPSPPRSLKMLPELHNICLAYQSMHS